jgi:hypothetical protein
MFYHMNLARKEAHIFQGTEYEIVVYRAEEDGHLRGYISAGGFSDRIAQISGETAHDMKATGDSDPVEFLVNAMKEEINAGKFPVAKRT